MLKITCFTDEKSHRVYVQSVPVCSGTTRTCVSTCARGAGTHGDVLNLRTEGFFCVPRRAAHHTTQNTHTTQTTHTNTRRQRQRQRQKTEKRRRKRRDKTREEKTKEDKTRQDKRREKIHFQCGGAWPFFVDVVIFWLIPFVHET